MSLEQIQKLPVYQRLQVSQQDLVDRIHEDLKVLRDSGIDIVRETRNGINYYHIDSRDEIPLNFENGFDATLLRAILYHNSDTEQVLYAKSGVNKLLSAANVNAVGNANLPIAANMPKGAFIAQIAKAIAANKGLLLDYYSLHSQKRCVYQIIPQALVPHFESFYLRGYKIKKYDENLIQLAQKPLLFNTSRILTEPVSFSLPPSFSFANYFSTKQKPGTSFCSAADSENTNRFDLENKTEKYAENNASDYFVKVNAIVKIKNGCAKPLSEIAVRITAENPFALMHIRDRELLAQELYLTPPMYREDLFELLCFYGTDVELIAPKDLRQQFQNRLQYLENLVPHILSPVQSK